MEDKLGNWQRDGLESGEVQAVNVDKGQDRGMFLGFFKSGNSFYFMDNRCEASAQRQYSRCMSSVFI